MRVLIFLLFTFFVSCSTQKIVTDKFIANELVNYNLQGVDTLVDIGCQNGDFSKEILIYNPKLFVFLEDLKEYSFCKEGGKDCKYLDTKKEIDKIFTSKKYFDTLKNRFKYIEGKIDSIPIISASCNVVLCRKTVHEFEKREKMVSELYRILKKGGLLIIIEPEPSYPNQIDKYCNQRYLSKVEILSIFRDFKFMKSNTLNFKDGDMVLYKFSK